MRRTILALALLTASPAFADGDAQFRQQVEALVQQYAGAINSKNADGVVAAYAPDGVFLQADGKALHGADEIRKLVDWLIDRGIQDHAAVTEAYRYGNAGFAIGTFTDANEAKGIKYSGTWNATYEIDGDKLRLKLLAVSVPPPAK